MSAAPNASNPAPPEVRGLELDSETRCAHWRSRLDVIAIKMRCCGVYYACRVCHDAMVDHSAQVWPRAMWDKPAVLCGVCGTEMNVNAYLACANRCPSCAAAFNPGCKLHHHFYFEG